MRLGYKPKILLSLICMCVRSVWVLCASYYSITLIIVLIILVFLCFNCITFNFIPKALFHDIISFQYIIHLR
jgi:hypothetical protein